MLQNAVLIILWGHALGDNMSKTFLQSPLTSFLVFFILSPSIYLRNPILSRISFYYISQMCLNNNLTPNKLMKANQQDKQFKKLNLNFEVKNHSQMGVGQ